jgi:hypothetical protein
LTVFDEESHIGRNERIDDEGQIETSDQIDNEDEIGLVSE